MSPEASPHWAHRKKIMGNIERIASLNRGQRHSLQKWLEGPNGSLVYSDVTFEAVMDGGIWVRTWPPSDSRRDQERKALLEIQKLVAPGRRWGKAFYINEIINTVLEKGA
jgi:hypothetical protein